VVLQETTGMRVPKPLEVVEAALPAAEGEVKVDQLIQPGKAARMAAFVSSGVQL